MGREIVEVEQAGKARAGYGDEVIEQLAWRSKLTPFSVVSAAWMCLSMNLLNRR